MSRRVDALQIFIIIIIIIKHADIAANRAQGSKIYKSYTCTIIRDRKEEEKSQSPDRLDDMHVMLSTQEEEEGLKKSKPLTASLCNKLTAKN